MRRLARAAVFAGAALCALGGACVRRTPALAPEDLEGPLDGASVEALIQTASRVRGLPLPRRVEWRIVPPEGLEAAMAEAEAHAAERGVAAEEHWPLVLRAMGLVATAWTPAADRKSLVRDQLFGWYDPVRKVMHVLDRPVAEMLPGVEVAAGLALRAAVVHEAEHAVQDQNFDLLRLLDGAPDMDALLAARALAEGDATLVMMDALRELVSGGADPVPGERAVRDAYAAGGPAMAESLGGMSPFPREALSAAYIDGTVFAAALRRVGGPKLVDAAFRAPPVSTAQVLHPELYLGGVKPDAIAEFRSAALEKAGWTVAATGTAGELACDAYVGEGERAAGAGWRGDRFAVLRGLEKTEPALVWISTWAAPEDAERFSGAVWQRGRAECTVEERCDAGVPVWTEARGDVAVVVRGLPPDLEEAAAADAFAVARERPSPVALPGAAWREEPAPEPYADLATRSRVMPGRVLADRLALPSLGVEMDLPPGEWHVHEGAMGNFSHAFATEAGGVVGVALMPAAESVPLGAFAEGVARGASAKGNLTLAQTLVRTVSGRPAIEKWLVPTGSGPSLHVLAFGRNGWVITLVGVPPPGLPRADAEKFRRAVMELRIGPLRETEPDRPAEGGSSASPGLDPGSRRPMSMEKLMERAR